MNGKMTTWSLYHVESRIVALHQRLARENQALLDLLHAGCSLAEAERRLARRAMTERWAISSDPIRKTPQGI
jgi:hypothetical protein